jgi:plasmid stabilization system protein ParE
MPQVILTRNALSDLSRLKAFLQTKNLEAAKEAVATIRYYLKELATTPLAHAPDDERPDFRILIIPFGSSGYKAWYRYKIGEDIVIVSIKHQREIGCLAAP